MQIQKNCKERKLKTYFYMHKNRLCSVDSAYYIFLAIMLKTY